MRRWNVKPKPHGLVIVLLSLLAIANVSMAANRYVRQGATGNGSGSDWTNACTGFTGACAPSSLVRGDTYYVADGAYGSVTFNTANSGSLVITILKATIADHGTDTGWNNAFGDGQATFTHWGIYTDHYVFDGRVRNSDWKTGAVSQYGFKVGGVPGQAIRLDNGSGVGADNVTFRFIDVSAGGRNTGVGDDVIYGLAGHTNITFHKTALRDSDRTIFLMRGCWQNLLVEYSYMARNWSTPAIHGELLSDVCSDNTIFRYNIIEDIGGTGVWAVLNGGGGKSPGNTANGWKIYGNVIHWPQGALQSVAGIFFSANDASNSNWTDNLVFYNNTIVGFNSGPQFFGIFVQAGSNNVSKNNVFYDLVGAGNTVTASHNWYFATPHSNDTAPTTQDCTALCNIFTNLLGEDFTLSGVNLPNAGDSTIGAEYNTDMNGNTRGADGIWDRGAFEFGTGTPTPPNAPGGLRIQ